MNLLKILLIPIFRKRKEVKQMNADETRKISRENSSEIANIQLSQSIKRLNEKIQTSAKEGKFSTNITVYCDRLWNIHNNSSKLIQHFEGRGFSVKVSYFINRETFEVSWSEEK